MHTLNRISRAVRLYRQGQRERGAVLVEAAIAIPMLLMVILGAVEFGFGWDAKSANTSGVRTGVLRAASIGDKPETDMRIMQAIIGEIGADNTDQIDWVMIFEIDGPDHDATVENCLASPWTDCVVYNTGQLLQVRDTTDASTFQTDNFDNGGNFNTTSGLYECDTNKSFDGLGNFCAGARSANSPTGDIEIGVAVQYRHEWTTGILPFGPPVFRDIATSSTFLEGGADISPSSINLPSTLGEVYKSGFDPASPATALNGWSGVDASDLGNAPPNMPGVDFLGRFASESVSLTIDTPDAHTTVCVRFDLYVIGSWDQGNNNSGPDSFSVDIAGGEPPTTENPSLNANVDNAMGYDEAGDEHWVKHGQVIPIEHCETHSGPTATINFSALMKQGGAYGHNDIGDESWGVGDVQITVSN